MLLGLLDRRVATAARSKPVTRRMKRRLKDRLEYLPDGLTDHPVDHVRDPQPAHAAARLGNVRPTNLAGTVDPVKQRGGQPRTGDRPLLTQHFDRLPVRAGRSLVRYHLHQRRRQAADDLFHRHRRDVLHVDDRLRHPHLAIHGPVRGRSASGPFRVFCCCDRQAKLPRRLLNRDRLPVPARTRPGTLSGHYPAFQYYATLRLLPGHQPSFFRSSAYRPPGRNPADLPG
jgi:hypothetical protein